MLCLMTLKIDAKFAGKLTCAFKNDMRNLTYFHRLKNSDFVLESRMAELNQNKNSIQPDRDMIKHELRVASCKLRVTSYELKA